MVIHCVLSHFLKTVFYTVYLLDSVTNCEAIMLRKSRKEERKDNGKKKGRKRKRNKEK